MWRSRLSLGGLATIGDQSQEIGGGVGPTSRHPFFGSFDELFGIGQADQALLEEAVQDLCGPEDRSEAAIRDGVEVRGSVDRIEDGLLGRAEIPHVENFDVVRRHEDLVGVFDQPSNRGPLVEAPSSLEEDRADVEVDGFVGVLGSVPLGLVGNELEAAFHPGEERVDLLLGMVDDGLVDFLRLDEIACDEDAAQSDAAVIGDRLRALQILHRDLSDVEKSFAYTPVGVLQDVEQRDPAAAKIDLPDVGTFPDSKGAGLTVLGERLKQIAQVQIREISREGHGALVVLLYKTVFSTRKPRGVEPVRAIWGERPEWRTNRKRGVMRIAFGLAALVMGVASAQEFDRGDLRALRSLPLDELSARARRPGGEGLSILAGEHRRAALAGYRGPHSARATRRGALPPGALEDR